LIEKITPLNLNETKDREIGSKFCDTDKCEVSYELSDK